MLRPPEAFRESMDGLRADALAALRAMGPRHRRRCPGCRDLRARLRAARASERALIERGGVR